jgi:hypothetical protein
MIRGLMCLLAFTIGGTLGDGEFVCIDCGHTQKGELRHIEPSRSDHSGKSNDAEDYRIFYATPSILYYDKYIPTDQVIQDMQVYLSRWPQRDNKVTDIKATCESNTSCNVMGTISFQADASKRRSVGTASFQYHLRNDLRGHLLIDSVNGKPLTRQISNK